MTTRNTFNLQCFYPDNMNIISSSINDGLIQLSMKSNNRNLKSFANGLSKDIETIENAVSSTFSNGYVEGNNNRLKMIKRIMYGRAGLQLLKAKILY